MVISWFSAGVSSAIATKLAIARYKDIKIIYIHIDDQHEDTMRFVKDCESWFGLPIEILQSEIKTVNDACLKSGFVSSPYGASCTRLLKRRVREIWEMEHNEDFTYIWGYDITETKRANNIIELLHQSEHIFPLIENNLDKQASHGILKEARIKRPVIYDMGYPNSNCIGCIKGGMGYWNAIRRDFPEVFKSRCKMEEKIGGKIFKDFYLKDLLPSKGRNQKIIVPDCGLFCDTEIMQ